MQDNYIYEESSPREIAECYRHHVVSDLLKGNTHGGVHPRVVLGNGFDVVVPACLLPRQTAHLERFEAFLAGLERARSHGGVVAERGVSLGESHGINLGAQEGYIGADISNGPLHLLSHLVTVTAILLEEEWRRVPAALEVGRGRLQGAAAFVC